MQALAATLPRLKAHVPFVVPTFAPLPGSNPEALPPAPPRLPDPQHDWALRPRLLIPDFDQYEGHFGQYDISVKDGETSGAPHESDRYTLGAADCSVPTCTWQHMGATDFAASSAKQTGGEALPLGEAVASA
jgi:hypothetical protein